MATVDPIALAKKILPQIVKNVADKAAINEAAITAAINATSGLSSDEKAVDVKTLVSPAQNNFGDAVQAVVTNTIRGNLNKSFEIKVGSSSTEVDLNGLTPTQVKIGGTTYNVSATPVDIKDGSNTVAKISIDGGKLKITDVTDASKISTIELQEFQFKGETITPTDKKDRIEIGIKEGTLANKDVTLKDKKVTFDLESGVTMTNAQATAASTDTFKVTVDKDGGNKVTIEQLKDVDKAGKDLVLKVTAGGKEVNKTVKVKPEGTDATEESGGIAGWARSNWKLLTGVVAGLVGLFASSREEGGGYLGTALGAIGGLLVAWNYGLGGASAEEAKPAKP